MTPYVLLLALILCSSPSVAADPETTPQDLSPLLEELRAGHDERPQGIFTPVAPEERITSPAKLWRRGGQVSVQVNVDGDGNNIVGDAANEPSIAVDPNNSRRMAIGWRQFDSIESAFRQAGFGSSSDGGASWQVGVIDRGIFRSDPVLDSDAQGNFYYNSLVIPAGTFETTVYRSADGGMSWDGGVNAFGGDKQWMTIDRTDGIGSGNIYSNWSSFASCCPPNNFTRSTDGGDSFESPITTIPQQLFLGTTAVGPSGEVYVAGAVNPSIAVSKSTTLRDPGLPPAFDSSVAVDLGGMPRTTVGPNPAGLLGQIWVVVDGSPPGNPRSGWVYVLASIDPAGDDPLDIHLVRSEDGGATWSAPVRINDDPVGNNAWQWFGTLSIAPNGRLDAVWNDTREDPGGFDSALYYSFSEDGGVTWSSNEAVTPIFDPHLGWPQQNKLGDYYDMVSENDRVHVAYAATFNGEQDVYYLRLRDREIFSDGFESGDTSAWSIGQ